MTGLHEGAEIKAESGKTYLAVGPLGQANVWTAVDTSDHSNIVVLKSPSDDDDPSGGWPRFQHEMIMHELYKDSDSIRKQIDRVPPTKGSPPMLVLEIFETTLWGARAKRPFTMGEIKGISRGILRGLMQIHAKGLVYADLKMPNVMISGFDVNTPGDGSKIKAKLGDLGIVMPPCNGKVQPVAYRAPEVFFKGEIGPAADMWAFGLVACHLLEAQHRFDKTGLYDDLETGGGSMPEREQAMRYAIADDYDIKNVAYFNNCSLPLQHEGHKAGQQWDELRKRGVEQKDIEFIQSCLIVDPSKRPTASKVLRSAWFTGAPGATDSQIPITDGAADTTTKTSPSKPKTTTTTPSTTTPKTRSQTSAKPTPIKTTTPAPVSTTNPIKTSHHTRLASSDNKSPVQPQIQRNSFNAPEGLRGILSNLPGITSTTTTGTTATSSSVSSNPLVHDRSETNSPLKEVPHTSSSTNTNGSVINMGQPSRNVSNKRARVTSDVENAIDDAMDSTPTTVADVTPSKKPSAGPGKTAVPAGGATGGTYLSYR